MLLEFQLKSLKSIVICIYLYCSAESNIGEEGVRKLFSRDWPELNELWLSKSILQIDYNNISDTGLKILLSRASKIQ